MTNATDWAASRTEMYFLTFLEARNPKSTCRYGWFLVTPLPWLTDGLSIVPTRRESDL